MALCYCHFPKYTNIAQFLLGQELHKLQCVCVCVFLDPYKNGDFEIQEEGYYME